MAVEQLRITKIAAADVSPNRRRGGDIRVLLSPKTVGTTSGFMGVLTLAPREHVSEHYHPYSEEFLYVVRGRLSMRVETEVVDLEPGDALAVPIGARHRLVNTGDEEAVAVFHLGPLAPSPELGHVDTEEPPHAAESTPEVGGGRR
ncbi:cupin domain-containing protein [Microtetraspora fusca]|uniref:cupin domain-containing protein n=1 Tax=Microtetraspora fusca TaxID=1997 RepID=UPI000837A4BF|nr:cupin domain-containing protein [Microtetraspora fusca]